jgi:hypothetical protein
MGLSSSFVGNSISTISPGYNTYGLYNLNVYEVDAPTTYEVGVTVAVNIELASFITTDKPYVLESIVY